MPETQWAPAIKSTLGDVWHHVRYGGSAHCDHRIRLGMSHAKSAPPAETDYICKRCQTITKQKPQ